MLKENQDKKFLKRLLNVWEMVHLRIQENENVNINLEIKLKDEMWLLSLF